MNIKKILILLTLCCAPIACSNGSKDEPAESSSKTETSAVANDTNMDCLHIVETYCISCHQQSRICQKLGKKNHGQWNRTIKRMIKHGAKLNAGQKDSLAECLANKDDAITEACKL